MEENQKNEETKITTEPAPMCSNHPIMKTLFIGILIFLGAFCAFYVVADWHFKNMFQPRFWHNPRKIEHMMEKQMRSMDHMFEKESKMAKKAGDIIHFTQEDNVYRIMIDLRAFDNNKNNLNVTTNGNILTINGQSIKKSKHNEQISEFQQNYMFGDNVKLDELTKSTEGHYYIITIPITEENN